MSTAATSRSRFSQRLIVTALACASTMTVSIVHGQSDQFIKETESESSHQRDLEGDPVQRALDEDRRESPHQEGLEGDPRGEALEEDQRERPQQY